MFHKTDAIFVGREVIELGFCAVPEVDAVPTLAFVAFHEVVVQFGPEVGQTNTLGTFTGPFFLGFPALALLGW